MIQLLSVAIHNIKMYRYLLQCQYNLLQIKNKTHTPSTDIEGWEDIASSTPVKWWAVVLFFFHSQLLTSIYHFQIDENQELSSEKKNRNCQLSLWMVV